MLFSAPTVAEHGRGVEIPDVVTSRNWFAFEDLDYLNKNAVGVMGEENSQISINDFGWVTIQNGRYCIAVGPNVMNPSHLPGEGITIEEMQYGTYIDVELRDSYGRILYLPCIVVEVKAHTFPDGILQTGRPFPDGEPYVDWTGPVAIIEFVGYQKYIVNGEEVNNSDTLFGYEVTNIIIYDQHFKEKGSLFKK